MRKLIILLLSIWTISSTSCIKNKDNWDINIYGYLYNAKDSSVYKNVEFILFLDIKSSLTTQKDKIYHFSTDKDGFFQITYSKPPGYSWPELCWPDNVSKDCGNKLDLPDVENLYTPYEHNMGNLYIMQY